MTKWPSIAPAALTSSGTVMPTVLHIILTVFMCLLFLAVNTIVDALTTAKFPLFIVAHTGRNTRTVPTLTELSEKVAAAVFMNNGSSVCMPYSHPHFLGNAFTGKIALLEEADVILVLDTDLPWIDTFGNAPKDGARVFVIDTDPLKQTYGWSHIDAELLARADPEVALLQLVEAVNAATENIDTSSITARRKVLADKHDEFIAQMTAVETSLKDPTVAEPPYVLALLREAVAELTPSHGKKTLWLNEGISGYHLVFDHIRPDVPGSMITSGGSSLGWALGAAVGAHLGAIREGKDHDLVVAIVGDGTFLFGVPSSAYWIARKYNTVSYSDIHTFVGSTEQ